MPTISCPLCRRPIETGPEHCPHCHIRLPGAPPPQKPRAPVKSAGRRLRAPAKSGSAPVQLQCPACAHPITREDQWCKWCKWPVNRGA